MELSDVPFPVRLLLLVRDAVDPGTGILSQTPKCFIQLLACDQVSNGGELPFRIFLGEFSYSVDVCEHIVSSSASRYVSFQQIRTLASPFPPVGPVAARFRSPAVPHLRRYYKVVRLLQHPSVLPPVDPWLHVPLDPFPEGGPPGVRGDGELSSVPGPSLWSMPWARDPGGPARPRYNGRRQILPSAGANTSASQRYKILGLNPHGLIYASHPPVAR